MLALLNVSAAACGRYFVAYPQRFIEAVACLCDHGLACSGSCAIRSNRSALDGTRGGLQNISPSRKSGEASNMPGLCGLSRAEEAPSIQQGVCNNATCQFFD